MRRAAVLGQLIICAAAVTAVALGRTRPPERWVRVQKGAVLARGAAAYNTTPGSRSMADIDSVRANSVQLVPVWWQDDTGSTIIGPAGIDSTPSDTEIRQALRLARYYGLRVLLKPEVRCRSGVSMRLHDPADGRWFDSYWRFLKHYATIAQESACVTLCIGTRLDRAADEPWEQTRWAQLAHLARGRFLGALTYAANWDAYPQVEFWDSLDYVGIDGYFPVWTDPFLPATPDTFGLIAGRWQDRWLPEIDSFVATLKDPDKGVLFTELGYRSIRGCAHQPWNEQLSTTFDAREQRYCYMAACHAFSGWARLAGWYWRGWTTDNEPGGPGDVSYSPRGKPAREAARRWNATLASQRGANFITTDDSTYYWPRTGQALRALRATGADWASFDARWLMDDTGAAWGGITPNAGDGTPLDGSIAAIIDSARALGMNVALKCYIATRTGVWQRWHDPESSGVTDDWFDDYAAYIEHYAGLAEDWRVEMLNIGVELEGATNHPAEAQKWRALVIPAARRHYSGPLVYGASGEILRLETGPRDTVLPAIWEALDIVGLDAYFPLYDTTGYSGQTPPTDTWYYQTPDTADLRYNARYGWEPTWLPRLDSLSSLVGRPVVFTEIGYRSMDSAAWFGACDDRRGWWPEQSGTANDLYSVCFPVDSFTGYAVGAAGTIIKTTDRGATWAQLFSGTSSALYSVHLPRPDTGYVVGDGGTIRKTVNGGATWAQLSSGTSSALYSVHFPTRDTGYAVGADGTILRTRDGWQSYEDVALDGQHGAYRSVRFPQCTSVGYIVGDGGVMLKTTDRGTSWQTLVTGTTSRLNAVDFDGTGSGVAVGADSTIIRTTDGGQTWTRESPGFAAEFWCVRVADAESARFVGGDTRAVLRCGDDWPARGSRQATGDWERSVRGLAFPAGDQFGIAVGTGGLVLRTARGGRKPVDFNEQKNIYAATFRAFWGDTLGYDPPDWFLGFHLWNWETEPEPKLLTHEPTIDWYTPQGKPAEQVLRSWYGAPVRDIEPGMGYLHHYPTGDIELTVPADGVTNLPLVPVRLSSQDWDADPTGSTPADSARLLQEYLGTGDTVVAIDSTGWFAFKTDTVWQYRFGPGRYRLYVRYKSNTAGTEPSPRYQDLEHPVIWFDAAAPVGSLDLNSGARFATVPACTVRVSGSDAGEGRAVRRCIAGSGPQPNTGRLTDL